MRLSELPTPALLVDVAAMERNIRRMADFFAGLTCKLRPHFKAHKTPEIAVRQLAAGSCTGLTCATVGEAEVASTFCDDILVANEVVDAARCDRLAGLARRVRVTVAVDSLVALDRLSVAADRAGTKIGVLVDINVGMGRCGVAPGDEAVSLAKRVAVTHGVWLRGVMGYEGHLQPVLDRGERVARTTEAMALLVGTAHRLREQGTRCDVVSAGGTGTYDITGLVPGITEVQAGSYVLMDTDYARVGVPFEQALTVLGTVVSRPAPDRCVADCGHKSMTKDHGLPLVRGVPGAEVVALNDEHATLRLPSDSTLNVGDRIELVPSHVDPTLNLHDVIYGVQRGQVVGTWPIARGYAEQRTRTSAFA
jgi:D-serine deaminase-like pyridoxal phosphate-dependent protein